MNTPQLRIVRNPESEICTPAPWRHRLDTWQPFATQPASPRKRFHCPHCNQTVWRIWPSATENLCNDCQRPMISALARNWPIARTLAAMALAFVLGEAIRPLAGSAGFLVAFFGCLWFSAWWPDNARDRLRDWRRGYTGQERQAMLVKLADAMGRMADLPAGSSITWGPLSPGEMRAFVDLHPENSVYVSQARP